MKIAPALVLLSWPVLASADGWFVPFGDETLLDVADDGQIVVGYDSIEGAFRWTPEGGVELVAENEVGVSYRAAAISGDGVVLAGYWSEGSIGVIRFPYRHTAATGIEPLPREVDDLVAEGVRASSVDGGVLVGWAVDAAEGIHAVRWDATGLSVIGELPGGEVRTSPRAVSADGVVVVGTGASAAQESHPFRWTEAGGFELLDDLPGGEEEGEAYDVSDDGSIVVGYGKSGTDPEAMRWVNGVPESLGWTGPVGNSGKALGVSGDGTRIVGGQNSFAFLWEEGIGFQDLATWLEQAGLDLQGWQLTSATGISRDGRTFIGLGRAPGQDPRYFPDRAWIAHVPEPASSAAGAASAATLALLARRRRNARDP